MMKDLCSKQLFLLTFFLSAKLFAASINIPISESDQKISPADDLVYQGVRIDAAEALKLKESGVDLSKLDPYISNLWTKRRLSTDVDTSQQTGQLSFLSTRKSPTEIFRAYVANDKKERFSITASLDNHTNLIRAILLRSLGFDIDLPKMLPETWFNFKNKDEKENFIELLGEQTLTNKKRWIVQEKEKSVKLRYLIISPPKLKNVNVYLPLMSKSRQVDRRVFRSLLALYAITDFPEAINRIDWNVGSIFNNNLTLIHPYANSFKDTSIDDIKWMVAKMCALPKAVFEKSVSHAHYPKEISPLVLEKLKSRTKTLAEKLDIDCSLEFNLQLNSRYIKNGKLTKSKFKNTAINYGTEDETSPYRFSELFRLFRTQTVYSSLSNLLSSGLEEALPGLYNQAATNRIQDQIREHQQNNLGKVLPIKLFSAPTAFGRLFTTRNIIFGQYLGNTAPIQLVDTVGAEINLGIQSSLAGVPLATPNFGISSSLSRSYSHIRAMPDLKTATKQKVKNLYVPRLMKQLGRIIKNEYNCSIDTKAFVEESTLDDKVFYYVKYDESLVSRAEAMKKRKELIDNSIPAAQIILVKIDRASLCTTEIAETKNKTVQSFLKSFAEGETFIISDSLKFSSVNTLPIPVAGNLALSLSADASKVILRSIIFKKINDSIQVTIQRQNSNSGAISEGIIFFIQLLNNRDQFTNAKSKSKVYNINLDGLSGDQQKTALLTIRQLFVSNDKTLLYDNYKAKDISHKVKTYLNTFKLLWFKRDRLKMDHDINFVVPNKKNESYTLKERTRKFYHVADFKRKGSDFQSFTNGILTFFSRFLSIGTPSLDPGKTFAGRSKKTYVSTEAELTKGFPYVPTTRVELVRSGWNHKNKRVEKFLDEIDSYFSLSDNYKRVQKTILHGSSKLQSYDLRTTIILYPSAIERIVSKIVQNNYITSYLGDKSHLDYSTKAQALQNMIEKLDDHQIDLKKKTKLINKLYRHLFNKFNIAKVLDLIGEENFFASTRITGFRKDHHTGFLEYNANTLGNYNTEIGTGILDRVSSHFNITNFEMRALNFTPGM